MEFAFVSGDIALDFTGTVGRRRTLAIDLLAEPPDFARWVRQAGLLDHHLDVRSWEFAAALELREAVYRAALAVTAGDLPGEEERDIVNGLAAVAPPHIRLDSDGRVTRTGDATAALSAIARHAAELLGGPPAARIKECAAGDCTRLYLDRSKGGSRRWCDMRLCGNRAKVADFRVRHGRSL